MQKINELQRYKKVTEGQSVLFRQSDDTVGQARLIKMKINSPYPVNLFVTEVNDDGELLPDAEQILLAHCNGGLETLEFNFKGHFMLDALGSDIWLETVEGSYFEVQPTDFTNYARVWEREEVDPRILEIQAAARANQRLLEQQMRIDREQNEARIAAILEQVKNVNSTSGNAGIGTGNGATQSSDAGSGASQSGTPTGGTDGGGNAEPASKP